jgi:hypothetical protein
MRNLLALIADILAGYIAYREESRQGRWSKKKFLAALLFGALEAGLVMVPLALPLKSTLFLPVFVGCYAIAILNFAWFVPLMRRWKIES